LQNQCLDCRSAETKVGEIWRELGSIGRRCGEAKVLRQKTDRPECNWNKVDREGADLSHDSEMPFTRIMLRR